MAVDLLFVVSIWWHKWTDMSYLDIVFKGMLIKCGEIFDILNVDCVCICGSIPDCCGNELDGKCFCDEEVLEVVNNDVCALDSSGVTLTESEGCVASGSLLSFDFRLTFLIFLF